MAGSKLIEVLKDAKALAIAGRTSEVKDRIAEAVKLAAEHPEQEKVAPEAPASVPPEERETILGGSPLVGLWGVVKKGYECYHGSFQTKEEAIAGVLEEIHIEDGQEFEVAQYRDPGLNVSADTVLEQLSCDANDEAGEAAESWPYVDDKGRAKLSRILTAAVFNFLAEEGELPTFCAIDPKTVEKHVYRAPAEVKISEEAAALVTATVPALAAEQAEAILESEVAVLIPAPDPAPKSKKGKAKK